MLRSSNDGFPDRGSHVNYRARTIEIAYGEIGKHGHYALRRPLWCGVFVCWVLNQAGLMVRAVGDNPGERLCSLLDETDEALPGDIIRHANNHCGIVVPDGIVAGGMLGHCVTLDRMWGGTTYSIDELIRVAEMSGAETGEVR